MEVAVLGLGEAGGRLAADLGAAGCTVRGWDPARRPDGLLNAESDRAAVAGADVVLSVNAAAVALAVAHGVAGELASGTLYADLNTASPRLKQELAETLPVQFVDVALLGVVPSLGLATPALASGSGAQRFVDLFQPLGMPVEVVGRRPGDAAGLKLLRSVFMKGMAAAAIESIEAARAGDNYVLTTGSRGTRPVRHRRRDRRTAARAAALRIENPCHPAAGRDARGRNVRPGARRRATRRCGRGRVASRPRRGPTRTTRAPRVARGGRTRRRATRSPPCAAAGGRGDARQTPG